MSVVIAMRTLNTEGEEIFEVLTEDVNQWLANNQTTSEEIKETKETKEMGVQTDVRQIIKEPLKVDTSATEEKSAPKAKSTRTRLAPKEKASLYDAGEEKIGRDGVTIYVVKESKNGKKKWQKKKEKTVKKKTEKKVKKSSKKKTEKKEKKEKTDTSESEKKAPKPKSTKASKRKAPAEKAKNYNEGEEKEGQDGEMYVVKSDKKGRKRWAKKKVKTVKKEKTQKKSSKKKTTRKKTAKKSKKETKEPVEVADSSVDKTEVESREHKDYIKVARAFKKSLINKTKEQWKIDDTERHNNKVTLKILGEAENEYSEGWLKKRVSKIMEGNFEHIKYDGISVIISEELTSLSFTIE